MSTFQDHTTSFWLKAIAAICVVAVFVQMSAVSVTTMRCVSTGEQELILGQPDQCCAPIDFDEASVSAKCCEVNTQAKGFHIFKIPTVDFRIHPLAIFPTFSLLACSIFPNQFRKSSISQPLKIPPLAARAVLIQMGVLRI